ncbi:cyclin-domain-containing protein [Limtongia smithiae]|uniref:cyclin-domain-containing protein n=1 Tax=Limtongia smithiae TaxID=1125753 RepID=UPI0034CF93BF
MPTVRYCSCGLCVVDGADKTQEAVTSPPPNPTSGQGISLRRTKRASADGEHAHHTQSPRRRQQQPQEAQSSQENGAGGGGVALQQRKQHHGHLHSPSKRRGMSPLIKSVGGENAGDALVQPPIVAEFVPPQRSDQATTDAGAVTANVAAAPETTLRMLPRDFFACEMSDLVALISSMLSELIRLNDALPLVPTQLTRFHSRASPQITHHDYLVRITRFCSLEKSALLSMVFYIDLLCAAFSSFTISSLTVHRFLITAAAVASKGLCDSFCTNAHYARVGGVSLTELNMLEVEFLVRVGWRIVPKVQTLHEYYRRMISRMSEVYALEFDDPERLELNSEGDAYDLDVDVEDAPEDS